MPREGSKDDAYIPRQQNCRVVESQRTGNRIAFKMVCSGADAMEATGDVTVAAESYDGRMKMVMRRDGQSMEMSSTFTGKRVGPAPRRRTEGDPAMPAPGLTREIERYEARTPRSRALQTEAERVLPGGSSRGTAYFAPYPFFAERGEGHHVEDVDGNRYLDFMLNATSLILGHGNASIAEALGEQARKGTAFSTPTTLQIRVVECLRAIPGFEPCAPPIPAPRAR